MDSSLTPYLAVRINDQTEVPVAHVKNGEIVLNISSSAVRNLELGNEYITCNGRFSGTAFNIIVPVNAVIGIFAKESGQGLVFQAEEGGIPPTPEVKPAPRKPQLTIVK
jgi:stringent starvation protein B